MNRSVGQRERTPVWMLAGPRQQGAWTARRRYTRRAAHATALAAAGAIFGACAQGGGGTAPAPAERTYHLSFMTSDNYDTSGLGQILDEFRKANPKAQVDALQGNEEKLRSMMAAGTPPDVSRINDNYVFDYADQKLTQPMDPFLKKSNFRKQDFYELIYNFGTEADGKRWAWPMGAAGRLLFLNLELFRRAGVTPPPSQKWDEAGWTMDDYLDTARRLSKPPDTWGALVFSDTGYEQTWSVNFGHPDGVFSKDGKRFTLADPVSIEAMQWVADLAVRHQVHPDRQTQVKEGAPAMFESGKVAMLYSGFGQLGRFRKNAQFEWDVAPVPKKVQRRTVNSLITYGIPAQAKEPQGGWDILEFCAGPVGSQVFAQTGYVIPIHRKYADEITKAGTGQAPKNLHLFVEALDFHTLPSPLARNVEDLRAIYRPKLYDEVDAGKVTAREMLTSVRPAVEALLQKK